MGMSLLSFLQSILTWALSITSSKLPGTKKGSPALKLFEHFKWGEDPAG